MNMRKCYHLLSISRKTRFIQHASITPHKTIFTTPSAYVPQHHARFSTSHNLKLPDNERDDRYHTLNYKLLIKNRDVVRATRGLGTKYWLPQSNLDLLLPPLQAGVFFCYKRKRAIMSPENVLETVKNSLGGVLSALYPLAGEIVANSHGEPEVLCNNIGVEFVHAHADVEMRCIDLHHPDESVKGKLVPTINHGVISVQVYGLLLLGLVLFVGCYCWASFVAARVLLLVIYMLSLAAGWRYATTLSSRAFLPS